METELLVLYISRGAPVEDFYAFMQKTLNLLWIDVCARISVIENFFALVPPGGM